LSLLAPTLETLAAAPTSVADASVVDLNGVRFAWPGPAAFTLTVDRFEVPCGERLLLVGPSGSGKSTLLNLICGIALPSAGCVRVLGTDLARLPGPARDRFRAAHIGIVFQMFNLLPYLSVLDNVLLPLSFAPERRAKTGGAAPGEARRLLARLGLDADGLADQPAARLSVGQQQRVAAARALIGTPEIVIADEPTSALDRDRQQAFLDLLFAEVERAGASLIMVSHDVTLAPLFDRTVRLDEVARTGAGRGERNVALP
jgi:putative ABC transport system ATP-binding protein